MTKKEKRETNTEPPICENCQNIEEIDCEGIDPGTDECDPDDGEYEEDDYYEPSEHDEWMDFDPDC